MHKRSSPSSAAIPLSSIAIAKLLIKQEQDSKKAKELSAKINDLEKKLGPEYFALAAGLKGVDPNSSDAQEINSILEELDESCGD
jgi:hypothetical protein